MRYKMKILIGCEVSGIVRDAFIKKGHEAYSCDIEDADIPLINCNVKYHLKGDVRNYLYNGWDMGLFFPPCTDLSVAGANLWEEKKKDGRQQKAIEFVSTLYNSPIPKICIENPVGILSTVWRKPDQIIHPYYFDEPYKKRTCLWLKGLPLLKPTNIIKPLYHWTDNNSRGGRLKDGTRRKSDLLGLHRSAKARSMSFSGVGDAMADQWG